MNDKFWSLTKDKQDKMINGSLKVFALNGFRHASTDEIVAEAGISKGLLFHYFYNKIGLYEFLSEYSARFALVELNSELRRKESMPLFSLLESVSRSEASAMRRYPYLYLFLSTAVRELDDGISIVGLRMKFPGEKAPDGSMTLETYDIVRCAFHAFEKVEDYG